MCSLNQIKLCIYHTLHYLAGFTSVDPIMNPRGLLSTDLAGGQEEGEALWEVLLPLLPQPLAHFFLDFTPVDKKGVLRHSEGLEHTKVNVLIHHSLINTNDLIRRTHKNKSRESESRVSFEILKC